MDDTSGRIDTPRSRAGDDADDRTAGGTEAVTNAAAAGSDDIDKRALEIRQDIDVTREEISETIDAIQEKLKPRNILANAADRVKSATAERVSEMADTAGRTARHAVDYSRQAATSVAGSTRQNVLPLTLIGIGAAWLLSNRARNASDSNRRWRGAWADERDVVRDYRDGSDDDWADSASQLASRTREYVSETADSVRSMARRGTGRVQRMADDSPLLVAAGALLLGVAFGLAVPETETENEWMGEARDSMVERARSAAKEAADEVQEAASSVVDVARKVAGKTDTSA